jgi:flagellar export protein FliJ
VKRYRFRLEPVLHVRRTERDLAVAGVLAAQAAARAEQRALEERDLAYAAALGSPGSRPASQFLVEQGRRTVLARAVLDGRRRVDVAEQAVEAARGRLQVAATEVSALERLDERQRAEHTAAGLREEDLVVDDLVVARAGRDDR